MQTGKFKELVLSFEGVTDQPHFNRTSFKVKGKRIFATLHEPLRSANLLLNPTEQALFCKMSKGISPVPNKWGENGWTTFELEKVEKGIILEGLKSAYEVLF